MRFAVAHKVATYLMVGCAYVALVAGGGLSPLIPSTTAPRARRASTASPRPASSGVQMLPQA